jgi:hypothetical protein
VEDSRSGSIKTKSLCLELARKNFHKRSDSVVLLAGRNSVILRSRRQSPSINLPTTTTGRCGRYGRGKNKAEGSLLKPADLPPEATERNHAMAPNPSGRSRARSRALTKFVKQGSWCSEGRRRMPGRVARENDSPTIEDAFHLCQLCFYILSRRTPISHRPLQGPRPPPALLAGRR